MAAGLIYMLVASAEDPFVDFRSGFVSVVMGILGLAVMVSLVVVVIHVANGDREAAQKMIKWLVVTAVGFLLVSVIKGL